MTYKIRKAEKSDMPAVLRLIHQLANFEREPDAVEVSLEELVEDGFGEHPFFKCHVLEVEEQVLGIALFYYRYSTWKGKTIHLEDLVIDENYRNKGYGEALMKSVLDYAASKKVRRIEWVVLDWNTSAVKFYKKMGATIHKDWNVVQMDQSQYTNALK